MLLNPPITTSYTLSVMSLSFLSDNRASAQAFTPKTKCDFSTSRINTYRYLKFLVVVTMADLTKIKYLIETTIEVYTPQTQTSIFCPSGHTEIKFHISHYFISLISQKFENSALKNKNFIYITFFLILNAFIIHDKHIFKPFQFGNAT